MGTKKPRLRIRINEKGPYLRLKTILAFESEVRSRTTGQTLYDLVMEAADIDSYPQEVRDRLRELEQQASREAVERALDVGNDDA